MSRSRSERHPLFVSSESKRVSRFLTFCKQIVLALLRIQTRLKYVSSLNPNIIIEYVLEHQSKWKLGDWAMFSDHLPFDDILRHPRLFWQAKNLSRNPTLSMDILCSEFGQSVRWNWTRVSYHPNISLGDMLAHAHLPWVWRAASFKKDVCLQKILQHPTIPWIWTAICELGRIPLEKLFQCMQQHPSLSFRHLSHHPEISVQILKMYLEKSWDWKVVSKSPSIRPDEMLAHPELPWDWKGASSNPNMTLDWLLANKESKPLCWCRLSQNAAISVDDMLATPFLPWVYVSMARHPNVSIPRHLAPHLDKPWDFEFNKKGLSRNPSMTIRALWQMTGKPLDAWELSKNPFLGEHERIQPLAARMWMACFRIQQWWRKGQASRKRLDKSTCSDSKHSFKFFLPRFLLKYFGN